MSAGPMVFLGLYKVWNLRDQQGRHHLAMTHGGGWNGEIRAVDLISGQPLLVNERWRIEGKPVRWEHVEDLTGYEWPRDHEGRVIRATEQWPDPWWDLRNANPTFRALCRVIEDFDLPVAGELRHVAHDKPRYQWTTGEDGDVARFASSIIWEMAAEKMTVQEALYERVEWWATDGVWPPDPANTPEQVWEKSGWAEAAPTLDAYIAEEAKLQVHPQGVLSPERREKLEALARGEQPKPRQRKTPRKKKAMTLQERLARLERHVRD